MAWTAPRTWVTGEIVSSSQMNTHVRDNFNAVMPLGTYLWRPGTSTTVETTLEGRFLECNGAAVSRAVYSSLFALTSTSFGGGDGSTTFNLPDLRGRAPVGQGGPGVLGSSEGAALANRGMNHHHLTGYYPGGAGGPSGALQGTGNNALPQVKTSGFTGLQDIPAHQVIGICWIKYTA
jgi:hypothetical protein